MKITNTVIDYELRRKLNISLNEYIVFDAIHRYGHVSLSGLVKSFGMSKAAMHGIVSRLIGFGYVERIIVTGQEAMSQLNADLSKSGCVVCGKKKKLHNHHYPIKREHGGKETILMCKKHHIEFHLLADHGILKSTLQIKLP